MDSFFNPPYLFMRALLALFLFSLMVWPADAQTIWSRPYEPGQITVEAMVPDLPEEADFPSGAAYLSGTASLSDNVEFAGELPVARYLPAPGLNSTSTTTLGNPYLGLGFSSTTLPFMLEVGTRLPVASSTRALSIGRATDIGRTRAFSWNEFSLSALANTRAMIGRRTSLRLRSGVSYASFSRLDATGAEETERDWRLLYSAQLWREGNNLILGLGFTGRGVLTAPGTYRANSRHHLVTSVMGNWNTIQPGFLVGLSLRDFSDEPSFLFGLTISLSYAR